MPVSFTIGPISTKGFVNLALIPLSGYIYIYIYIYIYGPCVVHPIIDGLIPRTPQLEIRQLR